MPLHCANDSMKRQYFASFLAGLLLLAGCVPMPPQAEQAEMENALKQPPVLEQQPSCVSARGDLGTFLDTENNAFIGYDDRGLVIYCPYDNSGIYKVDMKTGGKEQIVDLTEAHQHMNAVIYSSPWVVWVESADAELKIGQSEGHAWAIYAANIDTKEIVPVDGDNPYFSGDRNFTVIPFTFACEDNRIAYAGYEADADGLSRAVKLFDLNTKRLRTIAAQPADNQRGYSDPSMEDGRIVFCDVLMKDGELQDSKIYVYDIAGDALTELDNPNQLALPVIAERYAVAVKPWQMADQTVAIYAMDLENQTDGWIRIIDDSSELYKDNVSSQDFHSLQTYGSYLTWSSSANNHLYVLDVAENTFYDLARLDGGKQLGGTMTFNSDMLVWSEVSADGAITYPYVLLK